LCTVVGFYRYAEEGGVIEHSAAVHIRGRASTTSRIFAHLDRDEFGAIVVTAGPSSPRDHALVSLLAFRRQGLDLASASQRQRSRSRCAVEEQMSIGNAPMASSHPARSRAAVTAAAPE
jgi:hypothetical protein